MIGGMGRGIAVTVSIVLGLLAAPAVADPDDEIEMDPDGATPDKAPKDKAPPKDASKDAPKDAPNDAPNDAPADAPADAAPVKDPKLAKKLAVTGAQAMARGDRFVRYKKAEEAKAQYETALTAFTKAIELGDDENVYYDLGVVEDHLGKWVEAATHWRHVIKATAGVRPDILKKAQAKFDDITLNKVGKVTFKVTPDGTTITLDNVEVGKTPLAEPLILMPGSYSFQLAADGFQLKTVDLKVDAGSESERGIDLEPIKIIIEKPKPVVTAVETPVTEKPPSKLPLYIGGGAAAGLFAIGTVTGILAVGKHGTFTSADSSASERSDARSSGKTLAHLTDGMFVGMLAAGGFTAYWYFTKYRPAQRKFAGESTGGPHRSGDDPLGAKTMVVPWVQSDAGGVSLGGWF